MNRRCGSQWFEVFSKNKKAPDKNCQGRKLTLRGTTSLYTELAPCASQSTGRMSPILPRFNGRPRRSLTAKHYRVGAQLRNHVRQGLPYPFSAARALFNVSPRLLFPSSSFASSIKLIALSVPLNQCPCQSGKFHIKNRTIRCELFGLLDFYSLLGFFDLLFPVFANRLSTLTEPRVPID